MVGTADTKGDELAYVAEVVRARGVDAVMVDVGTTPHDEPATWHAWRHRAGHGRGLPP